MKPRLYVLSRPVLASGIFDFLKAEKFKWTEELSPTDAERLVEFAGRICYMSFGVRQHRTKHTEYIQNLITQGHESVLEHAAWTFLLVNVSRAFTHQLVRHRAGFSYSQLSQQYHDETDADFIMPPELNGSPRAKKAWKKAVEAAQEAYRIIQNELETQQHAGSQKKEQLRSRRSSARSVLPNATRTAIVVTANARALRHFLDVRGNIEGDGEMREVAALIYNNLLCDAPSLVADYQLKQLIDGTPSILKRTIGPVSGKYARATHS